MKLSLFFFLSLYIFLINFSFAEKTSLDDPFISIKKIIGRSHSTQQPIIQTCYLYKTVTILQVNNPEVMGYTKLTIRFNKPHQGQNERCDTKNQSGDIVNLNNDTTITGYFDGKYDNLILLGEADSFGSARAFSIIKIKNPYRVSFIYGDVARDNGKKWIQFYKSKTNHIGILYWKKLHSSCSLYNKNKEICWKKILKENHIQSTPMPNCKKNHPINSIVDEQSVIFMKVKIKDLENKKIKYFTKQKECLPKP